jgi:MFS family permease
MIAPPEAATAANTKPPARRLGSRTLDGVAVGIVLLAFLVPLRGLLRSPGPPFEEGFMLVFPERVLAGAIPNKDFLHLYGVGSLWVLAGWFKVFGASVTTERLFGLLQQMAIVFGVFALARRWGRVAAVSCALVSLLFILSTGLTALARVGGVGLGVLAIVAGAAARESVDDRRARRLALLAGLLMAAALLYRIDLVAATALAMVALGWGTSRALQRRFGIGLAAGLSLWVLHIAVAGPENVWRGMIIEPVFKLRGGRRLPVPPPWSHFNSTVQVVVDLDKLRWPLPTIAGPAQVSLWFFVLAASVVLLVGTTVAVARRDPTSIRARVLLAVAGFSVGIFPNMLQRADTTHFAWVACVAMAFLPVVLIEAARGRVHWQPRSVSLAAGGGVLAVLAFVITNYTVRTYADYSLQSVGVHRHSYVISHRGRIFYYGRPDDAAAANRLLDAVERVSKPGDRLIVAPDDLRRIPVDDAFFYHLLPQLTPGTRYIEMDPDLANAKDSGLADEVRHADVLILSSAEDYFNEPNDSRKLGPNEPNVVVRQDFCLVGKFGPHYQLYRRCHR